MASQKDEYIIPYMRFRQLVGWVAIGLPIAVWVGAYLRESIPVQGSVSSYYYTSMRDLFVGLLCAAGVFLCFYRGVNKWDTILAHLAGFAVIGIAVLPMDPTYASIIQQQFPGSKTPPCYFNGGPLKFHEAASVVFFGLISYMAIFRFPLTKESLITPQKQWRNLVYAVCGVAMVVGVGIIIWIRLKTKLSIFWPEFITIAAFGVAWLTKGQFVLQDKESQRTIPMAGRYRWGWGKGSPQQGSTVAHV